MNFSMETKLCVFDDNDSERDKGFIDVFMFK